jgi:hypothetical protein
MFPVIILKAGKSLNNYICMLKLNKNFIKSLRKRKNYMKDDKQRKKKWTRWTKERCVDYLPEQKPLLIIGVENEHLLNKTNKAKLGNEVFFNVM